MSTVHYPPSTSHGGPAGPACPALNHRSTEDFPRVSPDAGAFPADTHCESGTGTAGGRKPWDVDHIPWPEDGVPIPVDVELYAEADRGVRELVEAAKAAALYLEDQAWKRRQTPPASKIGASYRLYAEPEQILRRLRAALDAVGEPL